MTAKLPLQKTVMKNACDLGMAIDLLPDGTVRFWPPNTKPDNPQVEKPEPKSLEHESDVVF